MAETRKQATKKTARKTARKSTAKKSTAKKSTAARKGSTAKKTSSSDRNGGGRRTAATTQSRSGSNGTRSKASPLRVAAAAAEQLAELTGRQSEGVVGIEREDGQWVVEVEVLELRRIPSTTDVLARYRVTADEQGELTGYRRLHRYARGAAGEE